MRTVFDNYCGKGVDQSTSKMIVYMLKSGKKKLRHHKFWFQVAIFCQLDRKIKQEHKAENNIIDRKLNVLIDI